MSNLHDRKLSTIPYYKITSWSKKYKKHIKICELRSVFSGDQPHCYPIYNLIDVYKYLRFNNPEITIEEFNSLLLSIPLEKTKLLVAEIKEYVNATSSCTPSSPPPPKHIDIDLTVDESEVI